MHVIRSRAAAAATVAAAVATGVVVLAPPAPARAAGDAGLLGASTAAPLPVTVVGGTGVVPAALEHRLGRVGGSAGRLAGADRYATAVALARSSHPDGSPEVVLASGEGFPDALVAGPLAGSLDAPLLLARATTLPPAVAAELARLAPQRITVVGGPGVVGDPVVAAAQAAVGGPAVAVRRLAGADRFATAVAVARAFAPGVGGVVLATGRDYPDGVAATPLAVALGGPVLLSEPSGLPGAVRAELTRLAPDRLVLAGGTGALSATVAVQASSAAGATAERAAGVDRYATASALARLTHAVRPAARVFVATGTAYPDALSGGVGAAHAEAVLLLTSATAAQGAATAAEVGRRRGLAPWVQLTLDLVARMRALPEVWHAAYLHAYAADTLAHLYGWGDPEVGTELAGMRAAQKPSGGYGLDHAYDKFADGTVNPADTSYLVTMTDHAGRALIDGLRAGAVPAAEVAEQVDLILDWPRITGDPDCLAYSDSPNDRRWCVYNSNSGAGWFLAAAWDLGVRRPGQAELAAAIGVHDAPENDGTGWWPYYDKTPTIRQDWNHNAWTIEAHLTLTPDLGTRSLAQTMATGMFHPDPALRTYEDPMGFLRLLPFDCTKQAGVDAAAREVAAAQKQAGLTAQLALWAARTADTCGG